MKNFLIYSLFLALLTIGCTPSHQEEEGEKVVCNFEGEEWDALVDNKQYEGDLLYSGQPYSWYDAESDLAGGLTDAYGDSKFWGGGTAISNYASTDYLNNGTYNEQMTAFTDGAYSGKNFLLIYGSNTVYGDLRSAISFKTGAKSILSARVCITTYMYYVATTDNHIAPPLDKNGWIRVDAEGYTISEQGEEQSNGKTCSLYLFRNGEAQFSGWKEWDLRSLGKVDKVKFDFKASDNAAAAEYPAYLAVDDIVVLK